MSGQPGQIGSIVGRAPGLRDPVLDRLDALERAVRELATARSGNYTTITGTLDVEGVENVTGTLDVGGSASFGGTVDVGGTLDVGGSASFGGSVAITGTLSLPNGIINNAALATPVEVGTFTAGSVNSVTLTPVNVVYITKTIAIPAGFTTAVVYATTVVSDGESGTASSLITAVTTINGVDSPGSLATGTGGATAVAPFAVQLTGLGGGNVTVQAQGSQGFGTTGFGSISLNGFALFLR